MPLRSATRFWKTNCRALLAGFNAGRAEQEPMPWLAALVCCSAFDIALHDAYGHLRGPADLRNVRPGAT